MKRLPLAVALSLAAATPAVAGPPWITVEVRPRGPEFLVIHTFHHATANPTPLSGTAHGLVDGRRITVPLRFDALAGSNNSYAVWQTWGEQGVWVLSIRAAETNHMGAGTAVMVDRTGAMTVRFPRVFDGRTRPASEAEISAMLSALDDQYLSPLRRAGWFWLGGRLGLPLLLLALLALVLVRAGRGALGRLRARRAALA